MLPKIIRLFRSQNSAIEMRLHEMTTMEQIKALKEGRIDVGFGRIKHEDPNIRRILLREERMIAAVPLGHPLANLTEPAKLHELVVAERLIVFPKSPRPSFADQVLAAFTEKGLTRRTYLKCVSYRLRSGLLQPEKVLPSCRPAYKGCADLI
jgi:DNA-binding transcriptional LysR family regulator